LIVAVGNDLLGDDAVGVRAGLALQAEGLPVEASTRSGLALLDHIEGVRRVLLIDSQTTGGTPGTIHEFVLTPSVVRSPSPHYLGYGEAVAVGQAVGLDLPDEIRVLAVERSEATDIGAGLSEPVRAALPVLVQRAREIVRGWSRHQLAV
jgi:hydrogenase maturation protease